MLKQIVMVLLIGFSLCGCDGQMSAGGTETGNPVVAHTFNTSEEAETYLKEQDLNAAPEYADTLGDGLFSNPILTQEAGFDHVKKHNDYFYIALNNQVVIVKAGSANTMQVVNILSVSGQVLSLDIFDNILVVMFKPQNLQTALMATDISAPMLPKILMTFKVDGVIQTARLKASDLYVLLHFNTEDSWPDYELSDNYNIVSSGKLIASNGLTQMYYPAEPAGNGMMAVAALPLLHPQDFTVLSMAAIPHGFVISKTELYLAFTTQKQNTLIYKVILKTPLAFNAFGRLPGIVPDPDSISINNNIVQVACLDSLSNLEISTLTTEQSSLKVTGSTVIRAEEGLQPLVRFADARAFLFPFQSDQSLKLLDLTGTWTTKELSLTGAAISLYPMGDELLTMGISRDHQIILSLSNLQNIDMIQTTSLRLSQPDYEILKTPLVVSKAQNSMAVALSGNINQEMFTGVYVYGLNGFEWRGRLNINQTLPKTTWIRSFFSDQFIYIITPGEIVVGNINDLDGSPIILGLPD